MHLLIQLLFGYRKKLNLTWQNVDGELKDHHSWKLDNRLLFLILIYLELYAKCSC